jgi:hypothetical protein
MAPRFPKLKRSQSTPTRQVTGTSYTAQGTPGVKPPSYAEIGSAVGTTIVDPIPDLLPGYQSLRTYLKMIRDDSSVRISLRAGKAPVLGAEWYVEPFSNDPQDLAAAEFVEFNLFNGMTVPWVRVLEQILTMYEAGRSVFEPVWELREWAPRKATQGANRRQYTMLRKLAYRPASSMGEVTYDDNGGPISLQHTAIKADGSSQVVDIPIEKLVIFLFDQMAGQGGVLDGFSILRSAYKHWFYKDKLYAIDAIQKERHGIGVPDLEVQPSASQQDWDLAHTLGRNLRTNEFAYIVRTPNIKVGFAELKTQLVNALESAEHHDNMIMKNVMVQFLNLGSGVTGGGGGGRATGATSMDMFLKSMRHIADSICGNMNMYLIPNMIAYNFPTDNFPKLGVRGVGEVKDLQMWASAMNNLLGSDAITVDEATEQWIRAQMDMPRLTTGWVPPGERPEKTQVVYTGKTGDVPEGNQPSTVDNPAKSNNGGGGNIGKSPSSGAV